MRRGRRMIASCGSGREAGRLAGFAEREFCLVGQMLSGRMATSMIDLVAKI